MDTPGLNAIGAEPELTVSLIPQAHAVVFILGADTGVTKSDLAIWREHLVTEATDTDARLVVLNKIDTLWDALSTPEQIQAQIDRQKASTAAILGIPSDHVIAVSAQKGLVAKVTNDAELLAQSCLPLLEEELATGIMGKRQKILSAAMCTGIGELRLETVRVINIRFRWCKNTCGQIRAPKVIERCFWCFRIQGLESGNVRVDWCADAAGH